MFFWGGTELGGQGRGEFEQSGEGSKDVQNTLCDIVEEPMKNKKT